MQTLKIFHTSDIHGNIFATNYVEDKDHGLAKVSSLIKARSKDSHKLVIDAGDLIQGNSLAFYSEKHNITSPSIIEAFNLIGYDAITFGNHEFNYGLDYLYKHYSQFNNDIITANIKGLDLDTKPYSIYTFDDLKVGVIGLTTSFVGNWEQEGNIKGLRFDCPVDTYRAYEEELKEKSDIIIVTYHGGFECSLDDNITFTEKDTKENIGSKLIQEFDSIDIILSGHQHRLIAQDVDGVICMQPGANGANVSEITIDIKNKKVINYELVPVSEYDQDPVITDHFKTLNDNCNTYLDTALCTLEMDHTISDVADARLNSHSFLSLLGQIFNDYKNSDFVALSLFDTAIGFTKNVTIREVNQNYPFPNTIMQVKISGREMIENIKQANNYYTLKDNEITINPSYIYPKLKHYNYDMFYGLTYEVVVKEDENIIQNVLVNGNDIELDREYTILVSNYRYNNTEDYPVYEKLDILWESQDDAIEIILSYFSNNDNIKIDKDIDYKITKDEF